MLDLGRTFLQSVERSPKRSRWSMAICDSLTPSGIASF